MPTLKAVETRYATRSLTVKQAISDMQFRLWRKMMQESKTPIPYAELRQNIFTDILAIEYLNNGIEIVARNMEITNYTATFTQADFSQDDHGGWSMTYPTAAYRIDTVLYATGTDEGKALEDDIIDADELDQRVPNWRNAGTVTPPRSGVAFKKSRFGLYPKPSDSTYNVYLIGVGKPALVGYDTGSGIIAAATPWTLTDSTKNWRTDQFNDGVLELTDLGDTVTPSVFQVDYLVSDTTSTVLTSSGTPLPPDTVTFDYRVDNVIPLPDEFHGLCIDTAMNIFLSGGAMAAEEVLLKSQTFRRLKGDLQSSSYIEPFKADGSFNSNRR